MNKKQFKILCAKSVTGEITEREKEILKRVISESKEFGREYEEIKKIWDFNQVAEPLEIPEKEIEWLALERRLDSQTQETSQSNSVVLFIKSLKTKKLRAGFSTAFAAAILIAGILFFRGGAKDPVWMTADAGNREIKEVVLPDGSIATLNSGSEIKFQKEPDGESREIKLRGEAFFTVVKTGTPFVVLTGNSRTTVLGTKFDVRFRNGITKVIVKEGKVKLEPKAPGNNGIILTKNLSATIFGDQKLSDIDSVDADYLTGWLDGKLAFSRTPLKEIAGELERHYDVPVKVSGDSLNSLLLTGSFKKQSIDSALSIICLALGLDYSENDAGYLITGKAVPLNEK